MEAYATAADAKNGSISIIDNFVAKGSYPIEQGGNLVDLSKFQALVEKLDSTTSTLVSNMGQQEVISALNNGTSKTQSYGKSEQKQF